MQEILDLYEKFTVIPGEIQAPESDFFSFIAPSSLHSGVTEWGYGRRLKRNCVRVLADGNIRIRFRQLDTESRTTLKVIACLEEWEKMVCDLTISVNGSVVWHNSEEFVENVNLGWPALYYKIPQSVLQTGENTVQLTLGKHSANLLISEVSLICLPRFPEYGQISALSAVKTGEKFGVAIYAPKNTFRGLKNKKNCILLEQKDFSGDFCVLTMISKHAGKAEATAVFDKSSVELRLPEVIENQDFCLIGMDSDDHRHDLSEESSRIVQTFTLSGMGNYFLFRPQKGRNYHALAPEKVMLDRVDFLRSFGDRIGITDYGHVVPFLQKAAGDAYYATNIHEPYLFFNEKLEKFEHVRKKYLNNAKAMHACESFGEAENLYRDVLRRRIEALDGKDAVFTAGSPSMLSVYEADAGFDMIAIEPVSNINLLTGTIRNCKTWGAHIPVDWYFGAPNSACKSAKYRLAMQYLYLNGASFIYSENALFKTNAFSREDWESDFCRTNREYLREFYAYTVRNPREGKQIVDKAIVYGNHENFLWQVDDRMAELNAQGDWDSLVWGKWEDHHRKCWKAAEAWLPVVKNQSDFYELPVNKHLFSGTPYGNVDIVTCNQDWSSYQVLTFLGWNTMTPEILQKLKEYVAGGGTAVISYCHFNMTDRNDRAMSFPENGEISDLLGLNIGEDFAPKGDVKLVKCTSIGAQAILQDDLGNDIVFQHRYGKGTLYFCAFKDYFTADWCIDIVKELLTRLGKEGDLECDDPDVFISRRKMKNGAEKIELLHMNPREEKVKIRVVFRYKEKNYQFDILKGKIVSFVEEK